MSSLWALLMWMDSWEVNMIATKLRSRMWLTCVSVDTTWIKTIASIFV